MYEVLKFIEHGTQCRQSMDCEKGDLLIYYLRENRQMEKETLFEWFRQIGISADQFHRCRGGRRYRYLNPCSIVVAEDGRVYLLDLEAPENESVMKKMPESNKKTFCKNCVRRRKRPCGGSGSVRLWKDDAVRPGVYCSGSSADQAGREKAGTDY